MAVVRKSFDSYRVQYTGSKRDLPLASISCYNGTEWVGLLEFWEDKASVREPFIWQERIVLSYKLDRFADVIDLLRKEEPLELYLQVTSKWGSILTKELEPVGEEESVMP